MTVEAGGTQAFQYLDKASVKEGMTVEDVYNFLEKKGVSGKWMDTDTIAFETVCHNHIGEGSHKLFYYGNTKLFQCYTGGCGAFDIFGLIQKMAEVEDEWIDLGDAIQQYNESQEFVFFGSSEGGIYPDGALDYKTEYEKPKLLKYNPAILDTMKDCLVKDWLDEGISPETHRKYQVKYNPSLGSAVFPHYDIEGNCVGIRQRLMADDDIKNLGKYRPYNKGDNYYSSPLSFYTFGLNHNAENISRVKKAIIYEGEKSTMKMDDVLGPNNNISVASFGMNFSRHQFEGLRELGVEEIVIGFDRQFETVTEPTMITKIFSRGFIEMMEVFESVERRVGDLGVKITYMLDVELISEHKSSPIDSGIETFDHLYKNRKTLEEWRKELGYED